MADNKILVIFNWDKNETGDLQINKKSKLNWLADFSDTVHYFYLIEHYIKLVIINNKSKFKANIIII